MGAVQSSLVTESIAAGALVAGTAAAYAFYKRVVDVDVGKAQGEEVKNSASDPSGPGSPSSLATSASTSNSSKKNKGKKKKVASHPGGIGEKKSDLDAELDELLERARAERVEEEEKARRDQAAVTASARGLIPGAFEQEQDMGITALSSEAEGPSAGVVRERKGRKKGKKAATSGGATSATSAVRTKGNDDETDIKDANASKSPADSINPTEAPSQPSVETARNSAGASKKAKKRKGGGTNKTPADSSNTGTGASSTPKPAGTVHSSQALGMSLTLSDAPEDASWTRVSTRKKPSSQQQSQGQGRGQTGTDAELLTSDTNLTENNTEEDEEDEENEGSVRHAGAPEENRRTFAERMLPRPRKTGVEDIEDEPLQPTLARVIRVKPAPSEKPPKGFSWGDYEEYANVDEGTSADGGSDDAWEEVKSKKRSKPDASNLTSSADSFSLSYSSAPSAPSSSAQTTTKKQRQNAERREAARSQKDAAEHDRLERLAKHRRELERARIAEQYKNSGTESGKKLSGGMNASVQDGKLVWD